MYVEMVLTSFCRVNVFSSEWIIRSNENNELNQLSKERGSILPFRTFNERFNKFFAFYQFISRLLFKRSFKINKPFSMSNYRGNYD